MIPIEFHEINKGSLVTVELPAAPSIGQCAQINDRSYLVVDVIWKISCDVKPYVQVMLVKNA